jgi:outer membrane protein assembly factor BamB
VNTDKIVFAPKTDVATQTLGYLELYTPDSATPTSLVPIQPLAQAQFAVGSRITASLVIEQGGSVLAATQDGAIHRVSKTGTTWGEVALGSALPQPGVSLAIAQQGELVVGTREGANGGSVHRLRPADGSPVWASPTTLDSSASVKGLLLAVTETTGIASGAVIYATTSKGDLFALDADGQVVWKTQGVLPAPLGSESLEFPTVSRVADAAGFFTLYVGSTNGKLYAVIVDTGLDTTAPWPKAHHDLGNTNNAATPLE